MKNLYSFLFKTLFISLFFMGLGNRLSAQGTALQFSSNYVTVPDNSSLDLTNNFTVEAWIKPSGFNTLGGIVSKYQATNAYGFMLRLANASPYTGINFCEVETATGLLTAGRWYHVAGVVNAGVRYIYINGELVKTGTGFALAANTNVMTIGADFVTGGARYFNGQIDEVRVWNTARSQAQIQSAMYSALTPASESNLVAYYGFDENTGTTLTDLKGTNTGSFSGSPTWAESYAMVVPANTTTTNIDGKSFTANWDAPTVGAVDKYLLDVSTSSTFSSFVSGYNAKDCGSNLSQDVTGLNFNTTYYWRVRAEKTSVTGTGGYYGTSNTLTTLQKMSGTYTIDPDGSGSRNYTTFSAAISDLNTVGIVGPVTFLVKDDATFNETAELDLYATGTAANTITFIRSNDGTNKPVINVPAVGSAPYEMLFCSGCDYITLDGLDFRATSANTTKGIVFAANGTNGCGNNLIQNCNIQLNATNTTNTCFGIEFLFNSTSSNLNNNNKVNNNTISNVNQGIRFYGSGGGYDSGNEANGNSITNLGNTGTNQVIYGINIDYQLNVKISNNLIQFNPASQTSNLDVAGIRSGSGANTLEINGNTIKDANIAQGNTSEYFRGIYIATGATTLIHDNTIQNFAQTSTSGGCDVWGIKIESGNSTVYNNVIKDITNASTSSSARIVGMETMAGTANNFYNNKVFNLTSTGSGTNAGIEGLRIHSGSSNANIYNNMFFNLKCANGSKNPTVSGILLVSGNCNVYNNTVYIDNSSSTNANISTALYTSTSGTIDLRNNIFICNGTNTNGAWNIALYRNNSAFNLSATSNNNLYYAGIPGNNNRIYHTATSGTPTANTLLDYQAAVAPKENASVTEAATPFVSTSGTYDSHIKTDVPTLVEGHGVPITTPVNIMADIDGDTRNASTPDLGADEGDFMQIPYIVTTQNNVTATSRGLVNQEIIGVVINTNSTPSATSFTFNTTGSTNAATDIANAKLWYTGTTGTFATTTQVGSAVANPNGTFTITGSQTLTAGDNYFWLTYDVADGATVNNVLDAQCTSVTAAGIAVAPQLTSPAGSRSINGLLSGIYTINPSGSGARNFTTVTAAITALNVGIAGPVTFLVKDNATFNEVATLTINTTGTAENTISFQRSGDGTNKPKILFTGTSSTDACLRLNSCDYITFDGLEIQANGTYSNDFVEWGFYLFGAATNGCQHNTIKNCDISFATANTTLTYGIYLASVATNAAGANSYNTFLNNTILRPVRGYHFVGASGSYDVNNKVSTENSGVSSISEVGFNNSANATFGLEYQYQTNFEFANTSISFKSASPITSATNSVTGIHSLNGNNTASLHDNTITGLKVNKSDNALGVMGIYLENNASANIYNNTIQTIDNQNTNSQAVWVIKVEEGACNIYNNVISDIKNNSTATGQGRIIGIESAGTTANIYNNTISNLNYVNNSSVANWGNVVGILAYTGTTATIYNNMLYDLKAANSVANAVSGITFSCTNVNLYNNTVYLDYTSTNASNTSACVWQQNTGTLDMRNNIFINKSVMTTGTRAAAFYKTAGTLSSATNNNLYNAGASGPKNLIYYNGTGYQTLASYQAAVSPRDNKAVTEDATPFMSTSGTYNLHIDGTKTSVVSNAGTVVGSVTTDIDGETRNSSTPDIGADEFWAPQTIEFTLEAKTYGDADFTLPLNSSSGLPITYASDNSLIATISGNTVHIVGAGTCSITANQTGNASYYPALEVTQTLTVNKADPTITLDDITKYYGDDSFTVEATSNSTGTFTYSSSNEEVATITGNTVTIVGAGTATITASQAMDDNYKAATGTALLTVNKPFQTITFDPLTDKTYGDEPFILSATASSGLDVTFSSDNPDVAVVSGNQVTIVGAGSAIITASQAGNSNYSAANDVFQTLTVNQASQTITFGTLSGKTYGDTDFTLSGTASSGLSVNYASDNTAVATISGTTITIVGAGTAHITASQTGNTNYSSATEVVQTLTVNKQDQTITFGTLADKTYGDSDFTLSATASSGLGITYTSDNTAVATISGNAVTIVGAGTANILANQAGNTNYSAAPQVSQSLTVNKQTQTITFGTLTDKAFGDAPFTVSATGGTSGNPVTFTSSDDLIATCTGTNGSTITVIGAGSCTIYANQAGNVNYSAAGQVGQLLNVGKSAQSITFDALENKTYGDALFSLTGTASSSLPVSYISSNLTVATVLGDQVTIVGAGLTIIKASQTGSVNYDAATNVEQTLVVDKANQALTLNPLPVGELPLRDFASNPVQVTASSSSGLPVVISLGSGSVATLNGSNQLESIGATGNVIIKIDQVGNDNYNAASISHSFDVVKSNQSITFGALANQTYSPGLTLELSATASSTLAVGYTVVSGPATLSGNTLNISGAGVVVVTASQAGNETWNPATDVTQSLTVEKASQTITFGALANKTYGDSSFTLTGTASSGLSVSYISSNTAVATISGNQLTVVGAGTTSITASQAGNSNYNTATNVVQNLTVDKQDQAITFDALPDKSYDDAPFTISATGGTSGNPVTFTSSDNSIATCTGANGSTITIFGTGRCTIYANQAGNVNFGAAAQVEQELAVGMTPQTITFNALDDKTYGDTPFALSATASSGLNVTYTSDNELVATVSGNMVTVVGAGTANILANQAGDANYSAATQVSQSLTVNKKAQTITFGTLAEKTYSDDPFTLSATTSSGLVVSYTSDNELVATVSGNTVTIVGAGTANILANQVGNTNYSAATQVSQSLTVNKKAQTITFGTLADKTYGDDPSTLSATASSGLDVTYTSDNTDVAIVSGNTVTIVGGGTANILANQAGNTNYSAATQVSQSLTVNKQTQTITFGVLAAKTYGDDPFTLSATASSGLDVTYTCDNESVATVSGNTVTIVGGGTANILANQAGNTNYSAATQVSQSLTVNKQTQTITFGVLAAKTYGDTPFTLSATASSGLDVTYTSDNTAVATVSGNIITIVGAGTANILANQAGNTNYSAASQVSQSLTVNKKAQTITFGTLADKTYGDAPFTLSATASSGLDVSYTSDNSAVATVSGNTVTIVSAGTANILANQVGNTNYSAAPQVSQSLTVNKQAQAITFGTLADKTYGDASFTLSATASSGLDVTYTSDNTAVAVVSGNSLTIVGAGTANIRANQSGNTNYSAATQVSQSLTVNKQAQSITFGPLNTKVYNDAPFNLIGTSSSGLAVTYFSSNTDVATISGNTVTIVGAGNTTIKASQSGNASYSAATDVEQELVVGKANQILILNALPVGELKLKDFTDPIQVTASSSAGLPVVISLETGSVAILNGSNQLVSIGQTGNVIINVDQAGNDKYNSATIQYTFDVVKSNQSITFPELTSQTYSPGLTLDLNGTATASSSLDVTYSVADGPGTITGTTLAVTGAGNILVTASQGGNEVWNPATDATQTLAINKATPVISNFENVTIEYSDASFTLNATSVSTGLFTYSSSNTDVATITGNTVTIVGTGTTELTAHQDFDDNYASATATATLSVGLTDQVITFAELETKVIGDPDFTLSATGGGSGNPVVFTSSDETVAMCTGTNGQIVKIIGVGTCAIYANQAGNANYNTATQVSRSLTVNKYIAGDIDRDGIITPPEIVGDANGDGTITAPEIAGDTNGDGQIGTGEVAGDTDGDGTITAPEITGDTNGDGQIGNGEVAGDKDGDGTITAPEIAGDTNGDGQIGSGEVAGDKDGDGTITAPEIAGDTNGDGQIGTGEVAGDEDGDGTITAPEIAGDTNGDGQIGTGEIAGDKDGNGTITSPEIAGDTNGDGQIGNGEVAGDKDGDGTITSPEIAGDTNGDGQIGTGEVAGDKDGDGTITAPEIAGDTNGDGTIGTGEIVGDKDGDGAITAPELAGDIDGDGQIDTGEVAGDTNGDGTITAPEIAGDTNGDRQIGTGEVAGDKDGDGTITSPEIAGDNNGDGQIGTGEVAGDTDGDGTITSPEIAGDINGDGTIGTGEIAGDKDGDGAITSPEIAGDTNGDGQIGTGEVAGDTNGDGTITAPEIAGDTNGDGKIGTGEVAGDKDGDGTITAPEIAGDTNGDGQIGNGEVAGDKDGDGTITSPEIAGDTNGDGQINNGEVSGNTTKSNQTITFGEIVNKTFGDSNFNLNAIASSGLPVSYTSSNESVATISGNTVTITGTGITTITAMQSGNSYYNAASLVTRILVVVDYIAGDVNHDGQITSPEIAGDTNGDGQIGTGEVAGDKNGDGTITAPEIAGDTNGDGQIGNGEAAGDKDGDGTITSPEIAGDTNGDGQIGNGEIAGDTNGDGSIDGTEVTGDTDGNGTIDGTEVKGDSNGDGTADTTVIAGDTNGDGKIGNGEIAGDTNGDGKITAPEVAGDTNGDGKIDNGEVAGDTDGDGQIGTGEVAGDNNGDGSIGGTEVTGDTDGNGTINGTEVKGDRNGDGIADTTVIAGDTNGDGKINDGEIAGDTNGDGHINSSEVAGDTNGDGKIDNSEVAGDTNGDGTIGDNEVNGDSNGDGQVAEGETSQTIVFLPLDNKYLGDEPFIVSATGGYSGNPVTFTSSDITVATCSGTNGEIITIVGVGTCTITAHQNGNGVFSAATDVSQVLKVDFSVGIEDNPKENQLVAYAIRNIEIRIKGEVSRGAVATLYDMSGRIVRITTLEESILNVMPTPELKTAIYVLSVNDHGKVQTFKIPVRE